MELATKELTRRPRGAPKPPTGAPSAAAAARPRPSRGPVEFLVLVGPGAWGVSVRVREGVMSVGG